MVSLSSCFRVVGRVGACVICIAKVPFSSKPACGPCSSLSLWMNYLRVFPALLPGCSIPKEVNVFYSGFMAMSGLSGADLSVLLCRFGGSPDDAPFQGKTDGLAFGVDV